MGPFWEYFWEKIENTETRTWISMWINVEAKAFSLWSSVGWRPLALLVREPWNMRHFNTNACITAKRPQGPPDFWTRPNFSGSFEWKTKDCPEKETKVCVFTSFFFQFIVTSFVYHTKLATLQVSYPTIHLEKACMSFQATKISRKQPLQWLLEYFR